MIPAVRACGFVLRKNKDMPRMKRWSGTKKLKWVDVNKIWSKIQEGQPPRQNMLPGDGEMTSCYYMSFQEYVYGEGKADPSPVRDHFRRQDESSSSMSSSGRSHGRGRGSGKHNLDEVLKRLHALEQHVFMNRQPTEFFVEEMNIEQFWNDITFDNPIVSQRKYDEQESEERNNNAGNKFDDDVFDVNDYSEAKEVPDEDEIIITGIVDYFDEYDGKEVTSDKPRTRKPSQYLCPLYTEHITIWYRLLMERRFEGDRQTIMPPNFFVSHALEEGQDWRAFMAGIATYPNFMVAWWDVDTVLLPIHSSPNHWLFGELRLASMEVHIYDSLGRGAYEKFKSKGIFSKFERRVANYLDKIKYWARRKIPRIPLNMQFIYEENVPQQSSHLGDCGVFVWRLSGGLTLYIESKVQKCLNKSYNCNARRLYGDTFEVDDNFATGNVQLERRTQDQNDPARTCGGPGGKSSSTVIIQA
ncbi:uncharacterized protein LOC111893189 [Lactuca sativa]|uniref:uncharacterized protein LOC111893189 n=1 Tax=Lactuca sativa TaxID=4236 RepID=UPI0022AEAEF4|nr:uncharacterized protein LOC111893189 [Lactuca sativa]